MGNSLRGNKTTKVMKIDGETMKLKTPVKAGDVLKNYPGLVLLDSEAVKHYGARAKPLEAHKNLEPKRLYFLVELPKGKAPPRRIRSGINMSAKDRLENLMLARRSASDLSIMKQVSDTMAKEGSENGKMKLKLKLPKAEVEKLIRESKDEAEAAQRIMGLYMAATSASATATASTTATHTTSSSSGSGSGRDSENESEESGELIEQKVHLKVGRSRVGDSNKPREKLQKRVSFMPIAHQGGREIVVAS
ncbi:uncharacterized protein At1g66480-like [Prosopis cineraria]|uniref:uncharacterized protein At1g66480-like n=1 Tax=Prosopis cineraria TaxID=364024 RepID=UPI00241072D6|nr:uncharacterized protein At1g66480-like [Prosopis cineraria]